MTVLVVVLALVAVALLIAVVVLGLALRTSRRAAADLAAELDSMRHTRALGPAGRAVQAVVQTAVRVREGGVTGLLTSSLDDLARWAREDRTAIEQVAAPDGTVTFLFSDIEDSTTHNERLGDDAWIRLLDAHDALMRSSVERHGGHVVKTQGDGFMVAFADPVAAVRAAVDVQSALARGRDRRLRRNPIKVRVGAHVGTAVSRDGDYFGRNVAMAARVAAQAQGGEVLVSEALRETLLAEAERAGTDEFTLDPRGATTLKGITGHHELWAVSSVR